MVGELASHRPQIDDAIRRVLDSGVFIGGEEVAGFERELAAATGARYAVGVSSGTDALHVIGMALAIGQGSEVVTTPLSFFSTAGSFARLGARIVFADIDKETLCLDPARAAAACGPRTAAIVTVNLFGQPAELPTDVACPVIEDSAQSISLGAPRGVASALSFFPTKNVGAIGDAGAVLTDDATLADQIRLLREHGARPKYHHVVVGGNFRLDALQAAVLRVRLQSLREITAKRRVCAERYRTLFAASPALAHVRLAAAHERHAAHQFVIRAPRRDALRAALTRAGIATQVYYPEPLHLQPCFAELGYGVGSFPRAEAACAEVLALPCRPTLTLTAQEYIVEQIARFYQR